MTAPQPRLLLVTLLAVLLRPIPSTSQRELIKQSVQLAEAASPMPTVCSLQACLGGATMVPQHYVFLYTRLRENALPTPRELFQLLGAPLSRLVMLYPSMSATVTAALRKMQSTIAASTRLGEQRGCVDLIVDGATVAHKFMDEAEAAKDTILREDERKAENLRANM